MKNVRSVGTPKYKKINGQEFYKGVGNPIIRSKMIKEMKHFFTPFIKKASAIEDDGYPIKISLDIYTPILNGQFDLDNLSWVYIKAIQDVMTDCGIIIGDNVQHITNTGECQFYPVADSSSRKLIIKIYKNWNP